MARSFGIVDEKVFEADFFLSQFESSGTNFFAAKCFFNAFVSAARSITFCMQASLGSVDGFREWYSSKQMVLMEIPEARFFNRVRSESQKIGYTPIAHGVASRDTNGKLRVTYYFSNETGDPIKDAPMRDVLSASSDHLVRLITLVFEYYRDFGYLIDPDQYYSKFGMKMNKLCVEDLEIELGLPPGWTNAPGGTIEKRLNLLRRHEPGTEIDAMFDKYLNITRASFMPAH